MNRPVRPREVVWGTALLSAAYVFDVYRAFQVWTEVEDPWRGILPELLLLAFTPVLIVAIWFGVGAARAASAVLLAGRATSIVVFLSNGGPLAPGAVAGALLALHAAAIALLLRPPSRAWFRERKEQIARSALFHFALAAALVAGVPAIALVLAWQSGSTILGSPILLGLMLVLFIPAAIFGRPHFTFSIGAGPADDTGVLLTVLFYATVAMAVGTLLWTRSPAPKSRGRIAVVVTVFAGLFLAMIAPQVRDAIGLRAALKEKVAKAQALEDAALVEYPALEGRFSIQDEGGRYGIKSAGRWNVSRGKLEMVADSVEIWNRFPRCTTCPALKSWRFEFHSARGADGLRLGQRRETGFSPVPATAGSDGRIVATAQRMAVELTDQETVSVYLADKRLDGTVVRYVPPGALANYWIGIELTFADDSTYPVSATNPFLFTDALAAKGLAADRCAAPRNIADAVERACHEALASMLEDPAARTGIEKGDDSLRATNRETTPLASAVGAKDLAAVKLLLDHGADPNQRGFTGYTMLMSAVEQDSDDIVAELLRRNANVNERYTKYENQDSGKTALILAAQRNGAKSIRLLLDAGADRTLKGRDAHTAYEWAEFLGRREAADLLRP